MKNEMGGKIFINISRGSKHFLKKNRKKRRKIIGIREKKDPSTNGQGICLMK